MIVRCTAKLRALLGRQAQPPSDPVVLPDDFYANLLIIERRKCLLVTTPPHCSRCSAPTCAPRSCARSARSWYRGSLPSLTPRACLSERWASFDGGQVTIAATAGGRSVLGCMHDLALTCRLASEDAGGLGLLDLAALHHVLQRHIYAARGYVPAST